jgi:hypothetical protein
MHASLPIAAGLAAIVAASSPAPQEWSAQLPRLHSLRPGL